jgi:fucokinase
LAGRSLQVLVAPELRFLHLGTSAEYLDHLTRDWDGRRAGRVMAEAGPGIAPAAVLLASRAEAAAVGAGSVVAASDLGPGCAVGRRCVVFGVDGGAGFRLPDHHCLWQVPMDGGWVTAWCGVDDNPKDPLAAATLGNRPLAGWLAARGIAPDEVWADGADRCLWTARLFPVAASPAVHAALGWMVDAPERHPAGAHAWRTAPRRSLAELAAAPDAAALAARRSELLDRIALRALARTAAGVTDQDAGRMARLMSPGALAGMAALADGVSRWLPPARRVWLQADLLAGGGHPDAGAVREGVWPAIAVAVAAAAPAAAPALTALPATGRAACALPARVDLAGGWSDTPPYSLEHPAAVLNLAVLVAGQAPLRAEAEVVPGGAGLCLELDGAPAGEMAWADLGADAVFPLSDPAALLKTAAAVCGYGPGLRGGLVLRAASHLPKGSGLGGSSILAAALVTVLQRIAGRPDDWRTVSDLVLAVEQRLGTGGGWQDQVGGLVPGAKLVASAPVHPIRLQVEPVPLGAGASRALAERLVLVDTGITRLARNVLQRVVGSYLARDQRVVAGIGRLADLARDGRDRLASGDLDGLADIIAEAWELNQSLDPLCSNPAVDALFTGTGSLCRGWKLCGAGGGGFAVAMSHPGTATALAEVLRARGARPVPWSLAVA